MVHPFLNYVYAQISPVELYAELNVSTIIS